MNNFIFDQYPPSLVEDLRGRFRKRQTICNVLELFSHIFGKVYTNGGKRWIEVPKETLHSILKGNHATILRQIADLISRGSSYSTDKHVCKDIGFTDKFISHFTAVDWKDFNNFIKTRYDTHYKKSEKQGSISQSSNTSYNVATFVLDYNKPMVSTYRVDLEKVMKVSEEIFDESRYETDLGRISSIQCAKRNLEDILSGDIKTIYSEKTGRYYTSITQLQRELRGCLVKEDGDYFGEMDLKCSHAMIILSIIKNKMTIQEYRHTFAYLSNPKLWQELATMAQVASKDDVKDKFQLYLNGSYNQNRGNPVMVVMEQECPRFTELLFELKKDKTLNLSCEVSKIEASVMHSQEVKEFLYNKGVKYDIIHDCVWFYGDVPQETLLEASRFILTQFKTKYDIEMVFTVEVVHKPKQMVSIVDWMKEGIVEELKNEIEEVSSKMNNERQRLFRKSTIKRDWSRYYKLGRTLGCC